MIWHIFLSPIKFSEKKGPLGRTSFGSSSFWTRCSRKWPILTTCKHCWVIKGSTQPQIKGNLISRIKFMYSLDRQWRFKKLICIFFLCNQYLFGKSILNSKIPKKSCDYLHFRTLYIAQNDKMIWHHWRSTLYIQRTTDCRQSSLPFLLKVVKECYVYLFGTLKRLFSLHCELNLKILFGET